MADAPAPLSRRAIPLVAGRAAKSRVGGDGLPRKVRELVKDLINAGFAILPGGGKGSHR